jgi:hypothetical protein
MTVWVVESSDCAVGTAAVPLIVSRSLFPGTCWKNARTGLRYRQWIRSVLCGSLDGLELPPPADEIQRVKQQELRLSSIRPRERSETVVPPGPSASEAPAFLASFASKENEKQQKEGPGRDPHSNVGTTTFFLSIDQRIQTTDSEDQWTTSEPRMCEEAVGVSMVEEAPNSFAFFTTQVYS